MLKLMQVATIEPGDLDQAQQISERAASVLNDGGLVVFPTETVYGVAASAGSDKGMAALRALKAEGQPRAFAVHLPDAASAGRYVDLSSPSLERLIRKSFPGPITLVVEVDDETMAGKVAALGWSQEMANRIYQGGTVSLRCPDHPLTQQMLAAVKDPVVAGAATRSASNDPPHDADEAVEALGDQVDLVIDGGRARYAKPSTVVRVRGEGLTRSITVEREGVYDERFVRKLMRWTLLMVCSGNTCRSPMAATLAAKLLADQRGLAVEDLEAAGVRVLSAGVFAMPGQPAAAEAVEAMQKAGLDLSAHRSRTLTRELIHEADVIYAMTEAHRQAVLDLLPSAADKVFRLDESGDVEDPIGSDATAYQRTAELIRRRLEQRLKESQP